MNPFCSGHQRGVLHVAWAHIIAQLLHIFSHDVEGNGDKALRSYPRYFSSFSPCYHFWISKFWSSPREPTCKLLQLGCGLRNKHSNGSFMPSWCEGDVNSSITPDHIIPKEVGSIDAHYDLRPCKRCGCEGGPSSPPARLPPRSTHSRPGWCS